MLETQPDNRALPPTPYVGPRSAAALALALLVPLAAAGAALLNPVDPARAALAAAAALAGGGAAVVAALGRHYPHAQLGLCNLITLTRAAGVAALAGIAVTPGLLAETGAAGTGAAGAGAAGAAWTAAALAAVILGLDGLDGRAARRDGLGSRFGARFDMEVDAALALVLAVVAWQSDKAGVWVLGLGAMRHAFMVAGAAWPWLRAPLPDASWRKGVCVIQIAVLAALLVPWLTPPVSAWLAGVTFGLLGVSFVRDVTWLWRRRPR